jgi:hypothetical protein
LSLLVLQAGMPSAMLAVALCRLRLRRPFGRIVGAGNDGTVSDHIAGGFYAAVIWLFFEGWVSYGD